ncbi:hypothetical protein [Shinella sp.]|uniref:hypothetical protein n=1 Tax=Shinella sp. TaxID=1870904 RepID=UPI0039E3A51E
MERSIIVFAALCLLAGCQATPDTGTGRVTGDGVLDLPENKAYVACLKRKTDEYALLDGSPLELGTIAVSACSSENFAFRQALIKSKGPGFANAFMRLKAQDDPKIVAEAILYRRSRAR